MVSLRVLPVCCQGKTVVTVEAVSLFPVHRLYDTYIGQISSVDKSPHIENSESQDQSQVKLAHNALDLLVFARQLLCQCFLLMLTIDRKIVDLGLGLEVLRIEAAHGVRLIVFPKDL